MSPMIPRTDTPWIFLPILAGSVVQETHHRIIQLGVVMNFPQDFLAAAACPEDQQLFRLSGDAAANARMGERERMGFVGTYL